MRIMTDITVTAIEPQSFPSSCNSGGGLSRATTNNRPYGPERNHAEELLYLDIVRFCAMHAKSRSPYAVTRSMGLSLYFLLSHVSFKSRWGPIRCIALFYSSLFQEKQYSLEYHVAQLFIPTPLQIFFSFFLHHGNYVRRLPCSALLC